MSPHRNPAAHTPLLLVLLGADQCNQSSTESRLTDGLLKSEEDLVAGGAQLHQSLPDPLETRQRFLRTDSLTLLLR